ncbi:MAG TPA: hypothetical protein VKA84_03870 [Gemmatimonadaceae bacterium]|nr:hypothetical protein [Gemmatimonadaceae bacterium]
MRALHRTTVGMLGVALLAGCADPGAPPGGAGRTPRLDAAGGAGGAGPIVTGTSNSIRDIGNGPE